MNFTKTIILALTFFLADRGTNAASLRGKAENGGDLRHLDETGVDALEPRVHGYIRHTSGGCIGENMDGKVFTNFNTRNDLDCYFMDNDGASGGYRACRRGAAGCAQLCNEEKDCVSFEYSKESDDENGTGKTCILSDSCFYDMTVKTENSSNYWYLKQPEIDGYTVHSTGGCYGENMDQHTTHHNSNAADCAALCNTVEDCFSFEFSKGEHDKFGKTCRISSTCSYDMTVHDESSNYYFYEKPTPTPAPEAACSDTIKVTGSDFRELVSLCIQFDAELLKDWDTSAVDNMDFAFDGKGTFNIDISNWNTAKVTSMTGMFYRAYNFNKDISNWNTAKVTSMKYMFNRAYNFNQGINNWNTAEVTSMTNMFTRAYDFNQGINNWNTAKVTSMRSMFGYASDFNQDISNWDTAKITSMTNMFYSATSFNQYINNWNTAKVRDMEYMFYDAKSFNQCLGKWGEQDRINDVAVENMFQGSNCEFKNTPVTDGSTEWCRDCS